MKIRTLWETSPGLDPADSTPWLIAALDEFSDECGPSDATDAYDAAAKKPYVRELILHVPESVVRRLFAVPEVEIPTNQITSEEK